MESHLDMVYSIMKKGGRNMKDLRWIIVTCVMEESIIRMWRL